MVIRASNAEKRSVAFAAVIPIVLPAVLYVSLNQIMVDPTPIWMLLLTIAATLLGAWFWFQRGFILSIKLGGTDIKIRHLFGLEAVPLTMVQSVCQIRIAGTDDFALFMKNGNVIPLNLGSFLDRKELFAALERQVHDHNTHAENRIDMR